MGLLTGLLPKLQQNPPKQVPLLLSWPGAGVLVFWQIGVMKGLAARYDLSRLPMLGSSSGALVTALAKGGACMDAAAHRGIQLLKEFDVTSRPFGLLGILGRLTRQWMEDVLPDRAAERCSGGGATLLVTTLPLLRTRHITDFHCRDDLMEVVMASSHIPVVVDWRMFVSCRWRPVVDGGLWWLLQRSSREYRPAHAEQTLLISPSHDQHIVKELHLFRRMRPTDFGVAQELVSMGQAYAEQLALEHHQVLSRATGASLSSSLDHGGSG
ncbi:hypothetical protein V8C86DRAFT_2911570 [Haematococcus lacustris]